ncbi:lipopolysaccharide biosynthesis protein [Vibrio mexicanus]|uniref:lipopolysaccharide biosynthesis protein n=1 Tax=Vibrio mexicanus TaxID=1004326 RepID=UPI00063CABB3|nr:hypothetical protein [Vibrio mexicanus]
MKTLFVITLFGLLGSIELWQVIACGALSVLILVSWQWYKLRKLNLISISDQLTPIDRIQVLKQSIPMMAAVLVTLALNQIDLFMLEWLASDQEVGYFAAATTIAHILPTAQATIAGLFLPILGIAVSQGSDQCLPVFKRAQKAICVVIGTLFLVLMLFHHQLLAMFDPEYGQAATSLTLLCGTYGIWALAAFSSTWLQYLKKGTKVVWIGLSALT